MMRDAMRGFTLMEVVVAVVIVALLTGVTAPVLFRHVSDARVAAAKADLSTISIALEAYALHVGEYPPTEDGLGALLKPPAGLEGRWRGPYVRGDVPKDPWGRTYRYAHRLGQASFELSSAGRDGRAGGTGEDADLSANDPAAK